MHHIMVMWCISVYLSCDNGYSQTPMSDPQYSEGEKLPTSYLVVGALIGGVIGWFGTTGFKSQLVRVWDILVIGPLFLYAAYLLTRPGCTAKDKKYLTVGVLIAVIAGGTITYNLKNYLVQEAVGVKIGIIRNRIANAIE